MEVKTARNNMQSRLGHVLDAPFRLKSPRSGGAARRGQTGTEYLLVLGGAIALIAIVGVLIYSTISTSGGTTNCNYDFVKNSIVLPPDGVNVTNPTACKRLTLTAGSPATNIKADFNFGGNVIKYSFSVKKQGSPSNCTASPNCCAIGSPPSTINVTPTGNGYLYMTTHNGCNISNIASGLYDINVTVYTASGSQRSAIEAGAIIAK